MHAARLVRTIGTTIVVAALACGLIAGCTAGGPVPTSQGGPAGADPTPPTAAPEERPVDAASAAAVAVLRELPFADAAVQVVVDLLAASGVRILDDFDADAAAGLTLTRWQAAGLAAEAASGGGLEGWELQDLVGGADGGVPLPYALSAWMLAGGSEGARFANALLADADPTRSYQATFPTLVLVLFLADAYRVATDATAGQSKPAPEAEASLAGLTAPATVVPLRAPQPVPAGVVGEVCQSVAGAVQQALGVVNQAVKQAERAASWIGWIGGIQRDGAKLVLDGLGIVIDVLTWPVRTVARVFTAIAMVSQVSSSLHPWRTVLERQPETERFGIDDEVRKGQVVLGLQPHNVPIPDDLVACAASFGVDITASAKDSPVTWRTRTVLSARQVAFTEHDDDALDASESARHRYRTGQESSEAAKKGRELFGLHEVTAVLRRNDVEKLRKLLDGLVLGELPAMARPFIEKEVRELLGEITGKLASYLDVRALTTVPIAYHGPPEEPRPPECAPDQPPPGEYAGPYRVSSRTKVDKVTFEAVQTGSLRATVYGDGAVAGRFTMDVAGLLRAPTDTGDLVMDLNGTFEYRLSGTAAATTFTPTGHSGSVGTAIGTWDAEGGPKPFTGPLRMDCDAGVLSLRWHDIEGWTDPRAVFHTEPRADAVRIG